MNKCEAQLVMRFWAAFCRPKVMLRVLFLMCLISIPFNAAGMGGEGDREYKLKAVYLLHFANFIEWPESVFKESGRMTICAFQTNELGRYLEEIDGNQAGGRVLETRTGVAIEQIEECHVLYVARQYSGDLVEIKKQIGSASILLVSEQQDFEEVGGIISYFVESNKLKISIDPYAASAANLKISSKLMQIAKRVKRRANQIVHFPIGDSVMEGF